MLASLKRPGTTTKVRLRRRALQTMCENGGLKATFKCSETFHFNRHFFTRCVCRPPPRAPAAPAAAAAEGPPGGSAAEEDEEEEEEEKEAGVAPHPAVAAAVPAGVLVDHVPFFNGHWPGARSDWAGDVGIRFIVETPCVITALGRHTTDGQLSDGATVILWDADLQQAIVTVEVGPNSPVESHYAYTALPERLPLEVGKEYRLTQRCKARMTDSWFDGYASAEEVTALAAGRYARFLGGCCRNAPGGFPNRLDGERRRAGMVNFKVAREGLEVVAVTREELAHTLARVAASEEGASPEAVDAYLGVLARLLALLVDELAAPVLAVVAPEADITSLLRLEKVKGPLGMQQSEGPGTVFSRRFAGDVAEFAHRYRGALDEYGAPMEAALVVSNREGEVIAAPARLTRAGVSESNGEGCLGAAELAALLPRGMAFARSPAGHVTAFLAAEVRQGRALRLEDGPR
mmetsp:Transcript_145811/g.467232  ORF Transcript_145811/g.467232 Transcript_145811/m.467232 type:complete len:462 (-) Transcript_145811:34-1419(-)